MRGLVKLGMTTVVRVVGHVPCRRQSGRPPVPLGARILTNPEDIFQHNMWDHVQWSPEDINKAKQKADENSTERLPVEDQVRYDRDANKYWNGFYEMHQNKFFKNRKWLFAEFPELLPNRCKASCSSGVQETMASCSETKVTDQTNPEGWQKNTFTGNHQIFGEEPEQSNNNNDSAFPGQHASFRILEVGCGAGNSVFPIINTLRDSDAFLYCFDFSYQAIQLVKKHPDYNSTVCHAFVHDVCDSETPFPFPHGSLDVILMVFMLSSIHPERMQGVLNRLTTYLKPGGIILFRDYGRYDLSQLRFKKGQCLSENFYTRQDGTCVYFFTKDEVHQLFSISGLEKIQNLEDRKLQVNRGKKVVMRRVWIQGKYQKT